MKRNLHRLALLISLGILPYAMAAVSDPFAELDAATAPASESQKQQDLQTEFEQYKQQHQQEYQAYKKQLMEEFNQYKKIAQEETDKFIKSAEKVWDQPELSSKKVWVDYSSDLKTRNKVDFSKGTIQISTTVDAKTTLSDRELRSKLKALIEKNQAEAFKDDKIAQSIEKRSKEKLELIETAEVKPKPILLPYVSDKTNPSSKEVDTIVDNMMKNKKEKVEKNKQGKKVVTLEVPLDNTPSKTTDDKTSHSKKAKPMADLKLNKLPKGARNIAEDVETFSTKSQLDQSLVYAIIETESAFNPMAKSPVPAYGLMQIVPVSAGKDATEFLFGKARVLSPSYLYAREKNIEIGTAYLHILQNRYLKAIENPLSRLYCSIAAYNTGAGNVAKAFTGNLRIKSAVPIINKMEPEAVYEHLIKNLPYDETRKYLEKVVSRMSKYSV